MIKKLLMFAANIISMLAKVGVMKTKEGQIADGVKIILDEAMQDKPKTDS